jgi:phosphatidylglycerophosphate synthase
MLDNWLFKSKLKNSVEHFVKRVFLGKISPNQMTLVALILGLLSALSLYLSARLQWLIILIIMSVCLMLLSFVFDAFDGALARLEKPSEFGGILDMFCDRFVEVAIIIAFISTDPSELMWPGIFSLAAIILCITMFLVVGGSIKAEELEMAQKVIYYRRGLMERSETFLFFIFITVLIFIRFFLLYLFSFLVFVSALLRLWDAYGMLIKLENNQDIKEGE